MPRSKFLIGALLLGYAFLYLPIVLLVIYSFNASRLVTVWGGWSTRWYGELLSNDAILSAAWLSVKIAAVNACIATVLGTMAGLALARFGGFRSRTFFSGLITAPMVMPEVITGLSLLLMFVSLGVDRGFGTIVAAHVTFTVAFVAVVVQSRLADFDRSIEEAAMDLGARPLKVFFVITLPIIAPALVSGWLLSFTLSLDDLVITSFTAGPSSTTLPMIVYSKVRLGVTPDINALATIIVALVAIGVGISGWLVIRREKIRQRDERLAFSGRADAAQLAE